MDPATTSQLDALFSSFTDSCNDQLYEEFIKCAIEFIDRLLLVFRKHDSVLRSTRDKIALAVGNGQSKAVVHAFMDVMAPLKEAILKRDPIVIRRLNEIDMFQGVDLASDWSKLSERTQTAFWQYLGKLVVCGNKCTNAELVVGSLSNTDTRRKLLDATLACTNEVLGNGGEVKSLSDAFAVAKQVAARLQAKNELPALP